MNNKGPKQLPCGTPLRTEKFRDCSCLMVTRCFLPRTPLFRFSVLSLTCTNCDLRELTGLWTIVTPCDLNALCRRSEMPLMHGTEAYTLFSLRDSLDSLVSNSVFGIVS